MSQSLSEILRSRAPNNSRHDQIRAADELDRLTLLCDAQKELIQMYQDHVSPHSKEGQDDAKQ